MNVLIVEDEPRAATKLSDMLSKLMPECIIIGIIPSVVEAVKYFKSHDMPDLVLMDINLADGSCFSVFEIITITAPIIFCTAHDEFALKAFQTNGIAYLLKPVTERDLKVALQKLDQLTSRKSNYKTLAIEQHKSRFLIQAGEKIFPVLTKDIAYFMVEEHGLKLYKNDGDSFFIDYTVTELTDLLNPADFFRINRQAVIAKNAVVTTTPTVRNARLTLQNNLELSISRDRIKSFRKWFEQ